MSRVGYINISLETFGALLSVCIILFLTFSRRKKSIQDKLFLRILICNAIVLFSDAMAWAFKGRPDIISAYMVRIANFLVFTFGYVLMAAFTEYLISYISLKSKNVSKVLPYIIYGAACLAILTIIVSQFNHMYYLIDEQNIYRRQKFFWVSQLFGIIGMVANALIVWGSRKALDTKEICFFSTYILLPLVAITIQIFLYGIALLYIATNICVICIYIFVQAEQSRILSEKELELEKSRTALILSQIQPHFIANTLTTICSLCDSNPSEVKASIEHFADYLCDNIEAVSDDCLTPFHKELEHTENYLYFEKMRFQERLSIVMDIRIKDFFLPILSLQPIVENAVKHGLCGRMEGGTLWIRTEETEESFLITVEDDGIGFDVNARKDLSHIGIENVRARLQLLRGGKLIIQSTIGVGTKAVLVLPKGRGVTLSL